MYKLVEGPLFYEAWVRFQIRVRVRVRVRFQIRVRVRRLKNY